MRVLPRCRWSADSVVAEDFEAAQRPVLLLRAPALQQHLALSIGINARQANCRRESSFDRSLRRVADAHRQRNCGRYPATARTAPTWPFESTRFDER